MDLNDIISSLTGGSAGQPGGSQIDPNQWNQTVGSIPQEQFGQAAAQAVGGIDPRSYHTHITPGVGGTNPLGQLAPQQQTGLAQSILSALLSHGLNPGQIGQQAGVGQINPGQMSPGDLAGLLRWLQQNHPGALGSVASQYQNQPNMLQAILGNPALMSTIVSLGEQFLGGKMQQPPNQGGFQGPYSG